MDPTENKCQFTDDKIKRLREAMPKAQYGFDDMDWFDFDDLDALLGRLEAAEKAIRYLLVVCQDDRQSYEYSEGILSEAEEAMDSWREVSGQSPVVKS